MFPQIGHRLLSSVQYNLVGTRSLYLSKIAASQVEVLGKLINYEAVGSGDHVVLCLPGALGTIESDFGPQLKGLPSDKLQLVAWDPPGYGKSRPPPRDFHKDFLRTDATMAATMMKNLGIDKYSLLGWSDGGIAALMLAATFPQHVRKMVVFGANAYVSPEEKAIYQGLRDIEKWSPRMKAPLETFYGKEYFKNTWESWVDTYISIFDERDGDLCTDDLANITCPTLIIHGAEDPVVFSEHPHHLHENIKNSEMVLMEKAKHNMHLRYPEEFNALVRDFLTKGDGDI